MLCWICYNILNDNDYILLPEKEDNFQIPKSRTYEIRKVDKFVFLYYTLCNPCITKYLDNYPVKFKKIMQREITG